MSRLSKFMAQPVKKIIAGEEIEFKPLTVNNLPLLMDLGKPEKQVEATKKLIDLYLTQCFPDSTKEERDNFGFQYFKEFMDAITEVNGLNELKANHS